MRRGRCQGPSIAPLGTSAHPVDCLVGWAVQHDENARTRRSLPAVSSAGVLFGPTAARQMGTVTRQLLAVLLLSLQFDNAHAVSSSKRSISFAIWGNDCQLPYDAERDCSESSNEEDAMGLPLPPPQKFEPCPEGYSCRCCFSKEDCAPDQGQCAVRQRTQRVRLSWVATL